MSGYTCFKARRTHLSLRFATNGVLQGRPNYAKHTTIINILSTCRKSHVNYEKPKFVSATACGRFWNSIYPAYVTVTWITHMYISASANSHTEVRMSQPVSQTHRPPMPAFRNCFFNSVQDLINIKFNIIYELHLHGNPSCRGHEPPPQREHGGKNMENFLVPNPLHSFGALVLLLRNIYGIVHM